MIVSLLPPSFFDNLHLYDVDLEITSPTVGSSSGGRELSSHAKIFNTPGHDAMTKLIH